MKLRNKKTGGIDDFRIDAAGLEWMGYTSLKEFCEVWEDYEEPKGIKSVGNIGSSVHIELGSKEEAEEAVDKLKAWERLKKRHFKFDDYDILNQTATWLVSREYDQYENDIKLLFGR